MSILINPNLNLSKLITILLLSLFLNVSFVYCDNQKEPTIKILGQVYFSLPQISDENYSVVPQIVLSGLPAVINPIRPNQLPVRHAPPSARFEAKQKIDYFVTQAVDETHQATRYNFIKGKNIFTPAYIKSQVLEEPEEGVVQSNLDTLNQKMRQEFNKNFQQLKEIEKTKSTDKNQNPSAQKVQQNQAAKPTDSNSKQSSEQISQDKSSQVYKEFKSIEALKEKNIRDNLRNQADEEKFQNIQKLVGYIVIGIVISFAILKKLKKSSEATLPKTTPERTQLRLRDTADDQDDQDDQNESDDSNQ